MDTGQRGQRSRCGTIDDGACVLPPFENLLAKVTVSAEQCFSQYQTQPSCQSNSKAGNTSICRWRLRSTLGAPPLRLFSNRSNHMAILSNLRCSAVEVVRAQSTNAKVNYLPLKYLSVLLKSPPIYLANTPICLITHQSHYLRYILTILQPPDQ